MKEIPLKNGGVALVDDEDYPVLSRWKWVRDNSGYAGSGALGRMHRVVMGAHKRFVIDHINGNKLDNRKENLRFCTRAQNSLNIGPRNGRKYKNVSQTPSGRWRATVFHFREKKTKHIGTFDTEIEAAKAYNAAAIEYHGEYAYLNKIP